MQKFVAIITMHSSISYIKIVDHTDYREGTILMEGTRTLDKREYLVIIRYNFC